MKWSDLPPDEIARRHSLSKAAWDDLQEQEWVKQYQAHCDRAYWTIGKCCAGCDHWQSNSANTGRCSAAGIMSGADVLLSIGVSFSSYMPEPGFPFTSYDHKCGLFEDCFDWSTLPDDYLKSIGAMKNGKLRAKPR